VVHYLPPIAHEKWYESELRIREIVDRLDDSWVCFHHIRFLKPPREDWGGRLFGEIDFLLGHLDHGFFGKKAKGGRYNWDQGSLRKIGGDEIRPDPIRQAQEARTFFLDRAKKKEETGFIPWNVFAAFPDMPPTRPFGPTGFEDAIFWNTDVQDLQVFKDKLLMGSFNWRGLPASRQKIFHSMQRLIMSERNVPPLRVRVSETEKDIESATSKMLSLNDEQMEVVREVGRHLLTVTSGRAGTGKTMLAVQRAIQLGIAGYRVLFFTPNVYLSTQLREVFRQSDLLSGDSKPEGEGFGSVHVMSLDAVTRTPAEMEKSAREFSDELLSSETRFDALVIDEYQDVSTDLFNSLMLVIDSETVDVHVHAFGDRAQATGIRDPWLPSSEFNVMGLSRQCRCSRQIQFFVDHVSGQAHRPNDIHGPEVDFIPLTIGPEQIIRRLLDYRDHQGMNLTDITPIVCVPGMSEREIEITTEIALMAARKKFAGAMTAAKTADQFKGCESAAVVLYVEGDDLTDELKRYLYMTMSRARAHLAVIAQPTVLEFLKSAINR